MVNINDYQQMVNSSNSRNPILGPYYTVMNMMSTIGVLADKIKQLLDENDGMLNERASLKIGITLGDLLKYIAAMATDIDMSMENVILLNMKKLELEKQKENEKHTIVMNEL